MIRTPILLSAIAISTLVAAAGCNTIFGVDDGVARSTGAGGHAATTAASTSSSAASTSSGSGGSGGGDCNVYSGKMNVVFDQPNNSNLVATYSKATDGVYGSFAGGDTTIESSVEVDTSPMTCFSIMVVLADKPQSSLVTFATDSNLFPSALDAYVQIDENDGPCIETATTREWTSTTNGTATMVTTGPRGVVVTLTDVTMSAVIGAGHDGTGTFNVNGTIEADCFGL